MHESIPFCISVGSQYLITALLHDKKFSLQFWQDELSLSHISIYCYLIYPYTYFLILLKNYQSPVLHFLQFFSSKYRHRGFWRQVVNVTEMMREEPTHYCQLLPLTWDDFLVKYLPFTKLNMNQNLKKYNSQVWLDSLSLCNYLISTLAILLP